MKINLINSIELIRNGELPVHKVVRGSNTGLILDDKRSTFGIPYVTEYNINALWKLNRMKSSNFRVEPVLNYPYRSEVIKILERFGIDKDPDEFYRIDFILWDFDKPSFEMWMDGNHLRMNAKSIYINKLIDKIKRMTE